MKRLVFILLLFMSVGAMAQQGLQMEFSGQDSIRMQQQRDREYRQLIAGNALTDVPTEDLKISSFNYKAEFEKRYTLSLGVSPNLNYSFAGISQGTSLPVYSPFYSNAHVLSAASYKLGDNFTIGGFSYGTNSVFNGVPAHNYEMNNFDNYGSTLILQYKVSKNFKIETQINVSKNGYRPPGF